MRADGLEGRGLLNSWHSTGNWFEFNLAESNLELLKLSVQWLARQSTLLQRLGKGGWPWDADELNSLWLDGQWLGQVAARDGWDLGFPLGGGGRGKATSGGLDGADLDHLLGDAGLGELLLNNVGTDGWLVQGADPLVQSQDWGWDDVLVGADAGLLFELWLESRWNSRAAWEGGGGSFLVQKVRDSRKLWLHDAHAWGLQVSGGLTVVNTAKADRARLQDLWGGDLNPGTVSEDSQELGWDVDHVDVVGVALQLNNDPSAGSPLDDSLALSELDGFAVDLDNHGAGFWDDFDFGDSGQDLDNLLLLGDSPGQNSDWDLLRSVEQENVLAVIDLVLVGLVVESVDELWLDAASGWDLVGGNLLGEKRWNPVQNGEWQDVFGVTQQTEVLDLQSLSWSGDLDLSDLRGTISNSLDQQSSLLSRWGDLRGGNLRNLANKGRLQKVANKSDDWGLGNRPWDLDRDENLVQRGSLTTDDRANGRKLAAHALLGHALLVLWGLLDGLLLLLSLDQSGIKLDLLLLAGLLAKNKPALVLEVQRLLDELLKAPPVHQLWQLKFAFVLDSENWSSRWLDVNSGQSLDNLARLLGLLSNDDGSLEGLGDGWSTTGSNKLNNGGRGRSILKLAEDLLDVDESIVLKLLLVNLARAQWVHLSLGGELDQDVELLGLRLGWLVLDLGGGSTARRWENANQDGGSWSVLFDLFNVGGEVNELGIRLKDETAFKTQRLTDWDIDLKRKYTYVKSN